MSRPAVIAAGCLSVVFTLSLAAQQQPPQGQAPPVFRSRVDSISVDVRVTAKQGNPVKDLKPEDFEIREAGKLQTIDSFKFIETPLTEARGIEPPRQILSKTDQERETANPENRIFIIFLDEYHTRAGNALFIKQHLAK